MPRARRWWTKTVMENVAFGAVCRLGRAVPPLVPALARALPSTGRLDYSDASHRVFASPRLVRFREMEYAIPRAALPDAMGRLRRMVDERGLRVSFPVEVRAAAADDVPLSTAHGRDTAYVAVHMYVGVPYEDYFREVERIMVDHAGRPHWGKIHFQSAATLRHRYDGWSAFARLRDELDPRGTFTNGYLERVLGR
jgi:L-gulonolactone oxidase